MARRSGHWVGRLGAIGAAAAVVMSGMAGLVAVAPPAAAATVPPWHWSEVTGTATLPWASSKTVALTCPSGYVPVSGGFAATADGIKLKGQHADLATHQFVFTLGNGTVSTQTANLYAWCATAGEVGTVTSVSAQSHSVAAGGRIGVEASCPDSNVWDNIREYVPIGGDAEWKSTGSRTVEFSGPGYANSGAWEAVGTSATDGDQLTVTVRCVPSGLAVSGSWNTVNVAAGAHTLAANCGSGMHVLNGGTWAKPTGTGWTDHGWVWASYPSRTTWTSSINSAGADTVIVQAMCIATNVPSITWTSKPPMRSNAASGTITFTTSEPFGQQVSTTCKLDGAVRACASGQPLSYGPLGEGGHNVSVDAVNTDGEHTVANYNWSIDLTPPTLVSTSPAANASVDAAFVAQFSEQVTGLDASSFVVVADGGGQPLEGTLQTRTVTSSCSFACTEATFTPATPLQGHQGYTATLSAGIHDASGNALTSTSWQATTADGVPTCTDADGLTTTVNAPTTIALDCTDPDADPLSYAVSVQATHGTLDGPDSAGRVTYTPDAGYVGQDQFTFGSVDAYGGHSAPAVATVTTGPDNAPTCTDGDKKAGFEAAVTVTLTCADVDTGQRLSYVIDAGPAHGGLGSISTGGAVTYTPYPGFSGPDSFTFHATDGYGGVSSVHTVNLDVAANKAPSCAGVMTAVAHAKSVSIPLSCTDPDSGQTLTMSAASLPQHGSLSAIVDRHVTYTPRATFGGTDSFGYSASDGNGGSAPVATVTLRVAPGATTLTLKAATLTLTSGKTDRLTSRLRDAVTGRYVNGQKVLLQRRATRTGTWRTVASATTQRVGTAAGTAVFRVTPSRSYYFRVVYRGAAAYRASAATALHVRVT